MNLIAVAAATVAAFLLGGAYYAVMPSSADTAAAPPRAPLATVAVELVRCAAVACLVAGLATAADISGALGGAGLGLALWVLPVVLLLGSVFHEGTPSRTALLHAGDWLLKLGTVGAVVGLLV